MPTKHRRIAVVLDPELSDALARSARRLRHRSQASLLRELALVGSERIEESSEASPGLEKLLAIPGVRPARGDLRGFLRDNPIGPVPGDDPYGLTRALEEQREEGF